MDLAILAGRNRKQEADPFNWVIRAKIQSAMDEQYHRCKLAIDQHLKAYYGERQASVFARAGITGRATVELFESQAVQLVAALAEAVRPLSRNPRAFQMIAEMTLGFVNYLDLVVGRIGPRIDLEMRNFPRSENLVQDTGDMWRESRPRILESLGRHREDFGLEAAEQLPEPLEIEASMPEEMEEQAAPVLELEDHIPAPRFDLLAAAQAMFDKPATTHAEEEEVAEEFEPPILDLYIELELGEPAPETVSEPLPSMAQWHEMSAEIALRLCNGELVPTARDDLRRAMADWFVASGVHGPDAEVEACARAFWGKFAPARPIMASLDLDPAGADRARFDRLAWQADAQRSAGLATGTNALPRQAEVRCSLAVAAPEMPCASAIEGAPASEEPDSMSIRYHVSWTERPAPGTPAPFIDIGWE